MKIKEEIIFEDMVKNNEFLKDENGKIFGAELIEDTIRKKRRLFDVISRLKNDHTK